MDFINAHLAEIFALIIAIDHLLAATDWAKANSTFQLVSNLIKSIIGSLGPKQIDPPK